MCEPLRGKICDNDGHYKSSYAEGYIRYANKFKVEDIKSAVEGLHKELRDWCDDIAQKSAVDAMINKWFEDVI